jgi:hypothetical protein
MKSFFGVANLGYFLEKNQYFGTDTIRKIKRLTFRKKI